MSLADELLFESFYQNKVPSIWREMMDGESLGIWMVAALQNNYGGIENPKERFTVLEMGPGSGLMMSDILRTIA